MWAAYSESELRIWKLSVLGMKIFAASPCNDCVFVSFRFAAQCDARANRSPRPPVHPPPTHPLPAHPQSSTHLMFASVLEGASIDDLAEDRASDRGIVECRA